ncbi:MAG: AMP-binding protein, partial [Bdellovibrionales bacterium]|nr:AMP-binding protein [Bdellovibrionales bacterium]
WIVHKAAGAGLAGFLLRGTLWSAEKVYRARLDETVKVPITAQIVYKLCAGLRVKIRKTLFGSEFKYAVSGGAKLNSDVARFLDMFDIQVLEGYGLTETCVATNANRPGKNKIGTVGPVLSSDIEIKLGADQEILFKGPNIAKGYYNRPSATKHAWSEDGWFSSGDLGSLDSDGYLKIEGRKKEIIVTSYGKNIAPESVEQELKTSKYISQAVLVGDGRPYCVALITLNLSAVQKWAQTNGHQIGEEIADNSEVRRLIHSEIERINGSLANFESVKKFFLVSDEFTIDNGLLTPTFKVKRKAVQERFQQQIDRLYS